MGVQCGVVGYNDGVLWDEHGVGTKLQGLRARAGRFGYGNGGVKTHSLVLAGFQVNSIVPKMRGVYLLQLLSSAGGAERQLRRTSLWIQPQ